MVDRLEKLDFDFDEPTSDALRDTSHGDVLLPLVSEEYGDSYHLVSMFAGRYEEMIQNIESAEKAIGFPLEVIRQMRRMADQLKPLYDTYCKMVENKNE